MRSLSVYHTGKPGVKRILLLYICYFGCTLLLAACGGGGGKSATKANPGSDIPELARWEEQMLRFGDQHCQTFRDKSAGFDFRLAAYYYDAQQVFYQIGDYTGDSRWYDCAQLAGEVYRDEFVIPNQGGVPGYWIFPHGLEEDVIRNNSDRSRHALHLLAHNAAYARETTPAGETVSTEFSREAAYAISSYLSAEDIGEPRRARLELLVDHALGHMDSWFTRRNAPNVTPFMVALTAEALIDYHGHTGDSRIVGVLSRAMDSMWDQMWLPAEQAFKFRDRGETQATPDLNLLIAPVFGWLYQQTGEARFLERGDAIFAGGVRFSFLGNGKQFNQNYRTSFQYIKFRSE